jgi:hypothetical protein
MHACIYAYKHTCTCIYKRVRSMPLFLKLCTITYGYVCMHVCITPLCMYIYTYIPASCSFFQTFRKLSTLLSTLNVRNLSLWTVETERVATATGWKHTLTTDSDSDARIAERFLLTYYTYMHIYIYIYIYMFICVYIAGECRNRSLLSLACWKLTLKPHGIYMHIHTHIHILTHKNAARVYMQMSHHCMWLAVAESCSIAKRTMLIVY